MESVTAIHCDKCKRVMKRHCEPLNECNWLVCQNVSCDVYQVDIARRIIVTRESIPTSRGTEYKFGKVRY